MSGTCRRCGCGDENNFSSDYGAEKPDIFSLTLWDVIQAQLCYDCLTESQRRYFEIDEFNEIEALKFRIDTLRNYACQCQYSTPSLQVKHVSGYEVEVTKANRAIDQLYVQIFNKAKNFLRGRPLEDSDES